MFDETDEWAEFVDDSKEKFGAVEILGTSELLDYFDRESANLVAVATRTGELLAEERQINAGLRTAIAEHAKTIGDLSESLRKQRAITTVAVTGCVALSIAILFLIFTS